MTSKALVSVLTPTHNGAQFVAETIESVLAQTYAPIEHVLVDDASSDRTPAILDDYARRYPDRIRVGKHLERAGPCRRRSDALGLARGAYLAWLDHDDLWLPTKIERQVEALERDPGAAFCYTQYEAFDHESGRTLERSRLEPEGAILRYTFETGCFFASSTALIRREAMERRGLRFHDAHFSYGDDYFLWLALLLDWRAARVDEVLTRVRRHTANESARLGRDENYELWSLALLDEFVDTFPDAAAKLGPSLRRGRARHWAAAARLEVARRRGGPAAAYAARSTVLDPAGAGRYLLARAGRTPSGLRRRLAARRARSLSV